jgi:excisionase family DNA binding protein
MPAERTQTSLRSVRRWIASRDLAVHRLGRSIRIAEPDLLRFLARCRTKASAGDSKRHQ